LWLIEPDGTLDFDLIEQTIRSRTIVKLDICASVGGTITKKQTMNFTLEKSMEILERTPNVLNTMLQNISAEWTSNNEGGQTWSVYDIIGHFIYGERTDWIPRAEIILLLPIGVFTALTTHKKILSVKPWCTYTLQIIINSIYKS